MKAALRQAGCRITRQRNAIIGYLAGRTDHPSARQIFRDLEASEPGLSLATVYNTLGTLVEVGLVREMDFEAVDNRYDTNLTPHANLICSECRSIEDFDVGLPVAPELLRDAVGFEAIGFRIEYHGTCARCRESSPTSEE
jgi:Fur family peroxide stress response transcriptional regulator